MTIVTQPNLIEVSDFRGGWSPDGENSTTDPSVLLDVLNLLPDKNTGSLVAREGFVRLLQELVASATHYVKNIFHFNAPGEVNYLIVVVTDGTANANNVRLYAVKLSDMTKSRIDTAGVTWDVPTSEHWGMSIDGIWYGGSRSNPMYSWDPSGGGTWDADAGTGNWRSWENDVNDSIDTATEYARDFAWTSKEKVSLSGDVWRPNTSIRYDEWSDDEHYEKGERVSRKTVWAASSSYWKSFRCTTGHSGGNAAYEPGTGADWNDVWEKVTLPKPFNSDSETSDKWSFIPIAAETSVACWHGDRLFLRFDGQGDKSRVQFSAAIKPDKGMDIPDVSWDPKNFAPSITNEGAGGGWLTFNDGKTGGVVQSMHSYGQYLVVLKNRAVWVLSGTDDATWSVRRVAEGVGCVGSQAKVEHRGLLYFLSDDGLYITDGTTVEPAPGNERVRVFFRDLLDDSLGNSTIRPSMWSFGEYIWIAVGRSDEDSSATIVYDPETGSFWFTDLPVSDACVYRESGVTHMAFGSPLPYATTPDGPLVYGYGDDDQDDNGSGSNTPVDVAWFLQTAWWPFGVHREERRIRRTWAVVRGAQTYTLTAYRNYDDGTTAASAARAVTGSVTKYIEGKWFADCYSVGFKLSGTATPATVHGIAVDTEPRRFRYHT